MPKMQIRYSDRSFDWLYDATPEQIFNFAKAMHEDAWNLRWRIEKLIREQYQAQSA